MLKSSKLNFRFTHSVTLVFFTNKTSMRRCQPGREILRCPVVKEVGFAGMVGRNGTAQGVGPQQRSGEASAVPRGGTGSCAPAISG